MRFTDADRLAIEHLSRDWIDTPPCFTPNNQCQTLVDRGLIEIEGEPGAYRIRLTETGFEMLDCQGEA